MYVSEFWWAKSQSVLELFLQKVVLIWSQICFMGTWKWPLQLQHEPLKSFTKYPDPFCSFLHFICNITMTWVWKCCFQFAAAIQTKNWHINFREYSWKTYKHLVNFLFILRTQVHTDTEFPFYFITVAHEMCFLRQTKSRLLFKQ